MSDLIIKPSGTSANFKVQNPSGTDKIVMNSSGTITTATLGSGVSGHGLITMFDQFYLEDSFSSNDSTITPWTRVTSSTHNGFASLNTGLTQSSGIFSFPETGLYLIQAIFQVNEVSGGTDNVGATLEVTLNNSSYVTLLKSFEGVQSNPTTGSFSIGPTTINCTNTTNVKFRFKATSISGDNSIRGTDSDTDGSQDIIRSHFSSMRIGTSQ